MTSSFNDEYAFSAIHWEKWWIIDILLKYLYLEFGIIIAYIIQNISKIVKFSIYGA